MTARISENKNISGLLRFLVVCLAINEINSKPSSDMLTIDLPVYESPSDYSPVNYDSAEERHRADEHTASAGDSLNRLLTEKLTGGIAVSENDQIPEINIANAQLKGQIGPFQGQPKYLESAILQQEGFFSKLLNVKDNFHELKAGVFQPKPIVDDIQEEEKYGNYGQKYEAAGKLVVGSSEGISNFFSNLLEVPFKAARNLVQVATDKLNNLGGKLVGL